MKKKLLGILIALSMVVAILPAMTITSFAAVRKPYNAKWLINEGDNHVWYKLENSNRKLTIGGVGAMPDFKNYWDQTWTDYRLKITTVIIESGVTSIGGKAFFDCQLLESVEIPSSLTKIGEEAFYSCFTLKSVTIPSKVTMIEEYAFYGCDELESVIVKATTPPKLGSNVFDNTNDTFKIFIPKGSIKAYKDENGWNDESVVDRLKEAYMVYVDDTANGSVAVSKDCFPEETFGGLSEVEKTVAVSVTPNAGYQLKSLKYNDGTDYEITDDNDDGYQFTMPETNVTVKAELMETSVHTHTLVPVNGQAPTEEADGWKEYYKCDCGDLFEDANGTILIEDLEAWKARGGRGYIPAGQYAEPPATGDKNNVILWGVLAIVMAATLFGTEAILKYRIFGPH